MFYPFSSFGTPPDKNGKFAYRYSHRSYLALYSKLQPQLVYFSNVRINYQIPITQRIEFFYDDIAFIYFPC
jgi:hypothetical protein